MPLALVTCGPAYEPIDRVRRITNHSTGELGAVLAQALHGAGFRVICLRGEMATHPAPAAAEVIPFSTNSSLADELEKLPDAPDAIFHAAALCDFALVRNDGAPEKIPSETSELVLTLRPAEKLLPRLRPLFPEAVIIGWKYELEGNRAAAIEQGRHQIARATTDACVVNGSAYGEGFGFLEAGASDVLAQPDKRALSEHLVRWTLAKLSP